MPGRIVWDAGTIAAKVADLKDARLAGADVAKVDFGKRDPIAPGPPRLTPGITVAAPGLPTSNRTTSVTFRSKMREVIGAEADNSTVTYIGPGEGRSSSYVHRKNTSLINSVKLSWRAQTVSADAETRRSESGPDVRRGRNRSMTTFQR